MKLEESSPAPDVLLLKDIVHFAKKSQIEKIEFYSRVYKEGPEGALKETGERIHKWTIITSYFLALLILSIFVLIVDSYWSMHTSINSPDAPFLMYLFFITLTISLLSPYLVYRAWKKRGEKKGELRLFKSAINSRLTIRPFQLLPEPGFISCLQCMGKGGSYHTESAHWEVVDKGVGDGLYIQEKVKVPERTFKIDCVYCGGRGRFEVKKETFVKLNDYLSSFNPKVDDINSKVLANKVGTAC